MFFKEVKCPNCETYHDETLKKCPKCHKTNELYALNRVPKHVLFLHPIAQISLFIAGFAFAGMLLTELFLASLLGPINFGNQLLTSTIYLLLTYTVMFCGLMAIVLTTRRNEFLDRYKSPVNYLYGFGYALTIVFVSIALGALISLFHETAQDNTNQATAVLITKNYPLIGFIFLGILGPICEELTYRVGLYSFFRRINKYAAFTVTIIVFALIHFDFDAEDMINELWALPSYLVAGFLLTLAYEQRGPACSMLAHVLYNSFAFVIMYIS